MLVDSHCHLDLLDYTSGDSLMAIIQRAKEQGVEKFLCVCVELEKFSNMLSHVQSMDNIFVSVGQHPNELFSELLRVENLCDLASHPKVIGIGETGLDYYRSIPEHIELQKQNFLIHIEAAKKLKKPLIIHTRQAREDTLQVLKSSSAEEVGGVFHCFTEDWGMAKQALDMGFYISISGIVTFKNAHELREVARKIPLSKLLIETDSPYLAPVPMRGKQNEPSYVYHVAKFLSELRQEPFETIAHQTTQNFHDLFF